MPKREPDNVIVIPEETVHTKVSWVGKEIKRPSLGVKKRYWVGTFPGGPFQSLDTSHNHGTQHAGVVVFPGFSTALRRDPTTGETISVSFIGGVADLTDEQVKDILFQVSEVRVIRENEGDAKGYNAEGDEVRVKMRYGQRLNRLRLVAGKWEPDPNYVPDPKRDKPMGCYVWMKPVPDTFVPPELSEYIAYPSDRPEFVWAETARYIRKPLPDPMVKLSE